MVIFQLSKSLTEGILPSTCRHFPSFPLHAETTMGRCTAMSRVVTGPDASWSPWRTRIPNDLLILILYWVYWVYTDTIYWCYLLMLYSWLRVDDGRRRIVISSCMLAWYLLINAHTGWWSTMVDKGRWCFIMPNHGWWKGIVTNNDRDMKKHKATQSPLHHDHSLWCAYVCISRSGKRQNRQHP